MGGEGAGTVPTQRAPVETRFPWPGFSHSPFAGRLCCIRKAGDPHTEDPHAEDDHRPFSQASDKKVPEALLALPSLPRFLTDPSPS